MQDPASSSWLHSLARETASLAKFRETLDGPTLRRIFLETCATAFDWPQRTSFRGLVVRRLTVEIPPDVEERRGSVLDPCGPTPFLEVVPEGYPEEAYAITGGFLFPCERRLEAGSVVRVELDVEDPERYDMDVVGFLARARTLQVEVAVEP